MNVINTVIHSATNANFTDFVYNQVYASADTTVILNGQSITLPKGLVITVNVTSIGTGANVFLLGYSKSILKQVIL